MFIYGIAIFDYINGWYNLNRIHSKLGYVSPNEFETKNHSQTKTKLNSVKCCKKSQLIIELTNLVAAMSLKRSYPNFKVRYTLGLMM